MKNHGVYFMQLVSEIIAQITPKSSFGKVLAMMIVSRMICPAQIKIKPPLQSFAHVPVCCIAALSVLQRRLD